MHRRNFLKLTATLPLLAHKPWLFAQPPIQSPHILILVELQGGNDSLNTYIPYRENSYYQLRPNLAIPAQQVLPLTEQLALHPALVPLLPYWHNKQLAILQGLGYAEPNLSHFRSIDIWDTGSGSSEQFDQGWLAGHLPDSPPLHNPSPQAISLTTRDAVLHGTNPHTLTITNLDQFLRNINDSGFMPTGTDNPALQHLVSVQNNLSAAASQIKNKLPAGKLDVSSYPRSRIGYQFATVEYFLTHGITPAVFKLAHGSFDTHTQQLGTHKLLLTQLAESLAHFASVMQTKQLWDRILIVTYSEFGRRVAENGNLGTDHGTAAGHFVLGGKVKGGIFNPAPDMRDLDNGNLRYTTDYRQLYASIIRRWWNIPEELNRFRRYRTIDFI